MNLDGAARGAWICGLVGLDGSPSYDRKLTVTQPNGCVGGRESRQYTVVVIEGSITDGEI